jgi:hypothetical protein
VSLTLNSVFDPTANPVSAFSNAPRDPVVFFPQYLDEPGTLMVWFLRPGIHDPRTGQDSPAATPPRQDPPIKPLEPYLPPSQPPVNLRGIWNLQDTFRALRKESMQALCEASALIQPLIGEAAAAAQRGDSAASALYWETLNSNIENIVLSCEQIRRANDRLQEIDRLFEEGFGPSY